MQAKSSFVRAPAAVAGSSVREEFQAVAMSIQESLTTKAMLPFMLLLSCCMAAHDCRRRAFYPCPVRQEAKLGCTFL